MYLKLMGFLLLPVLISCAYTTVRPVEYNDTGRRGVRFYEPLPILISTCESVSIAWLPDFSRGYSVEARAWLAENSLKVYESNAMLTQLHSQQDSSPILGTLGSTASEAIEQAGRFAALGSAGDTPLAEPGIWKFEYDEKTGEMTGLTRIFQGVPCEARGGAGRAQPTPAKPRGAPRPNTRRE